MNEDEILSKIRKYLIVGKNSYLSSSLAFLLYKVKLKIIEKNSSELYAYGYTDGEYIYLPSDVSKSDLKTITFIISHELLHLCREDFLRSKGLNINLWNWISDAFINKWLREIGLTTSLPVIYPEEVMKYFPQADFESMTTEQIYHLIVKEYPNFKPSFSFEHGFSRQDKKIVDWKEEFLKGIKTFGKESSEVEKILKEIQKEELIDIELPSTLFFKENFIEDYSYIFFDKVAWVNEELYLPGVIGYDVPKILFAVDVSGSIQVDLAKKFIDISYALLQKWNIKFCDFIYFDTRIKKFEEKKSDFTNFVYSGGGTSFVEVFDFLKEKDYDVCVILTDGYAEYPDEKEVENLRTKIFFVMPVGGNEKEARKYGSVAFIK